MNDAKVNELASTINDTILNSKDMQSNGTILISIDDKIICERFFGFSEIEKKISTTFQTQYLIGSITKQFTAAALLKALYEKEIVTDDKNERTKNVMEALQKTLAYYLPVNHAVWSNSFPKWAEEVTLHQLLVHSSGIPNYTSLSGFEKQTSVNPFDLVSFFKTYPIEFNPGFKFSYNNSGYFLLGIIIQAITNQPLGAYLNDKIFKPLEMNSTHLATQGTVTELKQTDPRFSHLAHGYTLDLAESVPNIVEVTNYALMQMPGAGGSIISSAEDLLKWNNALYFSEKIIIYELRELMLFPHIQTEKPNEYYGYGIEIKKFKSYKHYIHRGGIPGFHSMLAFIPKLSMSIVILSNVFGNRDSLKTEIETISSSLSKTLTDSEKAQKMDEILEEKYPNIGINKRKYDLTSLENSIIDCLEFSKK